MSNKKALYVVFGTVAIAIVVCVVFAMDKKPTIRPTWIISKWCFVQNGVFPNELRSCFTKSAPEEKKTLLWGEKWSYFPSREVRHINKKRCVGYAEARIHDTPLTFVFFLEVCGGEWKIADYDSHLRLSKP